MNKKSDKQNKLTLAVAAGRALRRAALRAREEARRYGTRIHVVENGKVVSLKP